MTSIARRAFVLSPAIGVTPFPSALYTSPTLADHSAYQPLFSSASHPPPTPPPPSVPVITQYLPASALTAGCHFMDTLHSTPELSAVRHRHVQSCILTGGGGDPQPPQHSANGTSARPPIPHYRHTPQRTSDRIHRAPPPAGRARAPRRDSEVDFACRTPLEAHVRGGNARAPSHVPVTRALVKTRRKRAG